MSVTINAELCIGCGCCSDVCTVGALELDEKAVVYDEHCIECKSCIDMCPVGAITAS
jgi:NAD-dependent dihydropyrimidine dehydrogenase PreA subunit